MKVWVTHSQRPPGELNRWNNENKQPRNNARNLWVQETHQKTCMLRVEDVLRGLAPKRLQRSVLCRPRNLEVCNAKTT